MRVARYPHAWSCILYSCRPLSVHWLLVPASQFLLADLVGPLRPTPPPLIARFSHCHPGCYQRGIHPGSSVGVVPRFTAFWWVSVALGAAHSYSSFPLVVGPHSSVGPIPSPPQETEATRHHPQARLEPQGFILLNVPPTRRRDPPGILGRTGHCRASSLSTRELRPVIASRALRIAHGSGRQPLSILLSGGNQGKPLGAGTEHIWTGITREAKRLDSSCEHVPLARMSYTRLLSSKYPASIRERAAEGGRRTVWCFSPPPIPPQDRSLAVR